MTRETFDLVVIGAGPAGYVAAIRAAQLGWNVACIERERALGGTCLRVGCIPSKALLESSEHFWQAAHSLREHGVQFSNLKLDLATMLARKDKIVRTLTGGIDGLFKKNEITRVIGHAQIREPGRVVVMTGPPPTGSAGILPPAGNAGILPASQDDNEIEIQARHILIATGSKPAPLRGVQLDGDRIGTSTEALSYPEPPPHLIVIGAGYIGLELGSVWRRLGSKVTVLEYLDRILPGMDAELADEAHRILRKQGLEFRLKSKVTGARVENGDCIVECEGTEPIAADRVLLAVGRVPNTDGLGLDKIGIRLDARGRIPVDGHYATGVDGIYAVGDVIAGPMLAHKAAEEAVACVEYLITGYGHVNYDAIPGVVYTQPEIASAGKTEEELKDARIKYRKGSFPFRANGRALCLGEAEGRIKILSDDATDRILGVHIIGPRAGDLIAEAVAAIEFGASAEDLARICHAHPTLAEAMKEAALATESRPIHI